MWLLVDEAGAQIESLSRCAGFCVYVPDLPGISNEVGRDKSFFLWCWPPRSAPVAYLLKSIDRWRSCVHP